jgi:outer membrane protein OmpA-like peptidoglycan-associated protein
VVVATLLSGCSTDAGRGALLGGGGGALIGALVDHGNPAVGALIGAAGGALAGGLAGDFMDKRRQDLESRLAPEINAGQATVELLPGHSLRVAMTPSTAFAPGSAVINPGFITTMQTIGSVVGTYGKMTITVIGHPDAEGSAAQRQTLAYQRAEAVRGQLIALGVRPILVTATDDLGTPALTGRVQMILTPLTTS